MHHQNTPGFVTAKQLEYEYVRCKENYDKREDKASGGVQAWRVGTNKVVSLSCSFSLSFSLFLSFSLSLSFFLEGRKEEKKERRKEGKKERRKEGKKERRKG